LDWPPGHGGEDEAADTDTAAARNRPPRHFQQTGPLTAVAAEFSSSFATVAADHPGASEDSEAVPCGTYRRGGGSGEEEVEDGDIDGGAVIVGIVVIVTAFVSSTSTNL
jgi:hypothetical protein